MPAPRSRSGFMRIVPAAPGAGTPRCMHFRNNRFPTGRRMANNRLSRHASRRSETKIPVSIPRCDSNRWPVGVHLGGLLSRQGVGPGFASVPEVRNTIPGDADNEVDDLNRRRRAVLLRQRIRRSGLLALPSRRLLQQVELLRARAQLLRSGPDVCRSVCPDLRSDVRRARRELLRSGRELLQPVELLPSLELLQAVELLQEPLPPDVVLP